MGTEQSIKPMLLAAISFKYIIKLETNRMSVDFHFEL
jgi:hypothetical protein